MWRDLRIAAAVLLVLILTGAVGAVLGDMLLPARFQAGPHRAELRITLAPTEVLDLGPVGYITKPLDSFGPGFRITVKEIPTHDGSSADSLSLEQYARLYSDFGQTRANAIGALLEHSIWCAVWADVIAVGAWFGVRKLLGRQRRAELWSGLRAKRRAFGVVAAALLVATLAVDGARVAASDSVQANVDEAFDGTPLEGASVDGELLRLAMNEYGPRVNDFIQRTNQFYDQLTANLRTAARRATLLVPGEHSETVLFTTGLHCNVGMARVIGEVANLWNPTLVISGGDDALGASGFDSSCISILADHLSGHAVVVAPGDHDALEAQDEMRHRGFTVLDGTPVDERGFRILGDDDPRFASLAGGLMPRRDETVTEMGHRLAERACADERGVDILVANEPGAVRETARRGCAPLVLAGAEQEQVRTVTGPNGSSVVYLGASAGGAAPNVLTVGALQAQASVTIIQLDEETSTALRHQRIDFGVDGSVVVGRASPFATAGL